MNAKPNYQSSYPPLREISRTAPVNPPQPRRRFRFRPRSWWPLLSWGLLLFVSFRIVLFPLAEGVYSFVLKSQEIYDLKVKHHTLEQQLAQLKQERNKMKTMSYVEERGHQIGLIKPNEEPMLVIGTQNGKSGVIPMTKKPIVVHD